jgi:phosphotransferase system HPr-like phosphotransfer protein
MGMMSLSVGNGDQVVVVTEGVDEVAAADEIETYLMAQ